MGGILPTQENILDPACFYLGTFHLFHSLPQVLLIVVQPIVDSFGQVCSDLGAGLVVARPIATGVLSHIGRGLGDDEDLVHILVVQLIVRVVLIGPVCELVFPGGHLLHLFIEHEVQFFLVGLSGRQHRVAFCRGVATILNRTRGKKHFKK